MTWPAGRHPLPGDAGNLGTGPRAAPGTYPVPPGRGQWRFLVLDRAFAGGRVWGDLAKAELSVARSRRLERKWNAPATLTFTVDGRSAAASAITELATDVLALRWNDAWNRDEPMFRGIVTQSQDAVSEQEHTVTFTCHDYSAVLWRRLVTAGAGVNYTQLDQDQIATNLLALATGAASSGGTSFAPGSFLPLKISLAQPNGASRSFSGVKRDRFYAGSTKIGEAIANLGNVANGFDWDVAPFGSSISVAGDADALRIFYPYQGVTDTAPALVYGSTVTTVSRSVNSADYANYVRGVGANGSAAAGAPQVFGEAWNTDVNNVTVYPVGTWMDDQNAADVSVSLTLAEKAQGDLAMSGILVPTYTLGLRPGAWGSIVSSGSPGIDIAVGDVLPLTIQSGRLDVNTTIRVLGVTFAIGDDGQEDVSIAVGRPATTLAYLMRQPIRDTAALTRR